MDKKQKINIPMCAALVLLLVTLLSARLTGGLYARYTSTGYASDSARVARFEVTNTVEPVMDEENNIQPGQYTVTVGNASEVAVEYSIQVELDSHLSVTLNGETKRPAAGESSVTFTNESWKLAPGENAEPLDMEIRLENSVGITDATTEYEDTEAVTFKFAVHVHAMQVD